MTSGGGGAGPDWAMAGVAVAALTSLGGFVIWAAKYFSRFIAWFRRDAIIVALATKEQVETLGRELTERQDAHEAKDAEAFRQINTDLGAMRDHMAKGADLARVEGKLDQLLVKGFGSRRT